MSKQRMGTAETGRRTTLRIYGLRGSRPEQDSRRQRAIRRSCRPRRNGLSRQPHYCLGPSIAHHV
jgi:hypothetical protein